MGGFKHCLSCLNLLIFLQYSSISGEMHTYSFILKEKHSTVNGNHGSHELCPPGGFILLHRILGEKPSSKSFPFMMDTADRTCPSTSTRSRPPDPHSFHFHTEPQDCRLRGDSDIALVGAGERGGGIHSQPRLCPHCTDHSVNRTSAQTPAPFS